MRYLSFGLFASDWLQKKELGRQPTNEITRPLKEDPGGCEKDVHQRLLGGGCRWIQSLDGWVEAVRDKAEGC